LVFCGIAALCCGGGPTDGPEYPKAPPKAAEPIVIKEERPAPGSIWRDELIDSLNVGLGSFLQHVEVEASLEDGRFKGFRILQLIPPGYWEGIDLERGDVVMSVNGMPIERETDAFAAFEALRSAKEIRVALLRAGAPRETVVSIVERPGVSPSSAPTLAGAGGATASSDSASGSGGLPSGPGSALAPSGAASLGGSAAGVSGALAAGAPGTLPAGKKSN
jgi:hypothetical protein